MSTSSLGQSRALPPQLPCCKSIQNSWHLLSAQQVLECTKGAKSHGLCVCWMLEGKEEQLPCWM